MFKCNWKACVNNMSGECTALDRETKIDGRIHILDVDECPFYKPRKGMGMKTSKARMMYFCDRTMCGDKCNRGCIYTPNVVNAVDPDGFKFSLSLKDGNFYQVPDVQSHRYTIDKVRSMITDSGNEANG